MPAFYGLKSKYGFVNTLLFNDAGIKVEFTKHESYAARSSIKKIVEGLANTLPLGKYKVVEIKAQ